jgi:hypothetical protein
VKKIGGEGGGLGLQLCDFAVYILEIDPTTSNAQDPKA